MSRAAELAANLADVRERIERACRAAEREPASVTLVAVTKTWPATDARILADLGVRDLGENRDQEAHDKAAETAGSGIRWHFVGQLQSNKARSVASYASVIHSVDRVRLADALAAGAREAGRVLDAFVQVTLDGDELRGGIAPGELLGLADHVAESDGLRLAGVMAVAPLGADPLTAYRTLAGIAADVRAAHPTAVGISAGMSDDFEVAIAAGSTVVRVGTALLGGRAPIVR